MTPDRSARRLATLLAAGTFLLLTLAFGVPATISAVKLSCGGMSPSDRKETVTALALSGVCALVGFFGFIQFALIATGRKKIVWTFGDKEPTTIDGKTDVERK